MNISFDENCAPFTPYIEILSDGVQEIVKRLGKDFSQVKWIIYNCDKPPYPEYHDKQIDDNLNGLLKIFIDCDLFRRERKGYYGFCDVDKKIVYISTATIERQFFFKRFAKNQPSFPMISFPGATLGQMRQYPFIKPSVNLDLQNEPELSLFTRVITDELAHIATQENHGSKRYEQILKEYRIKCIGL